MKAKKTTKKATKKNNEYVATAIVMGKKYQGKGATVSEAIGNLKVENCKGKCVLSVEHGDTKRERVLMPSTSFRLFSASRMMREIALKQTSQLFS